MSTLRTTPFAREELIEQAKRVHAGALSVIGHAPAQGRGRHELVYEAECLGAIVAVLEHYPIADFAEKAVNIIIGDLSMRKGFDDLILTSDFRLTREFLVELLKKSVVGPANPFPNRFNRMVAAESQTELSGIVAPATPPADPGDDLQFA